MTRLCGRRPLRFFSEGHRGGLLAIMLVFDVMPRIPASEQRPESLRRHQTEEREPPESVGHFLVPPRHVLVSATCRRFMGKGYFFGGSEERPRHGLAAVTGAEVHRFMTKRDEGHEPWRSCLTQARVQHPNGSGCARPS